MYETKTTDLKECNKSCDYTEMTTATENNPELVNISAAESDALLKPSRNRRIVSPCLHLSDVFPDPLSPSSSSSTNDVTFEPTLEMMVNDFDDEQTLNEEEALAALESQDPDEEIDTLKEESEMPLEDLLAKYQTLTPMVFVEPLRKKSKKSSSKKKHKSKQKQELPSVSNEGTDSENQSRDVTVSAVHGKGNADIVVIEGSDEKDLPEDDRLEEEDDEPVDILMSTPKPLLDDLNKEKEQLNHKANKSGINTEILKVRRTHLLDLYPEGTFGNVVGVTEAVVAGNGEDIPLETIYAVEEEEDEEDDEEYKKKVMIGSSYQASIPQGLSQYGDILPYENEDKLIWEPSQVTEREVEEYLLKIRDIKSNQVGDEEITNSFEGIGTTNKENLDKVRNSDNMENNSLLANGEKKCSLPGGGQQDDSQTVVKDNEQALHLLVQCGYDFKEALRRKRLNALPLNACMSLWSEEECQKFEEGIQKYGKDFLKIRQNQVRTRTMRELVQFYYLWKKSERRDHNFANADTVDHMDIYLNEDNEYGSNPASVTTPVGSPVGNTSSTTTTRRNSQKNISIMTNTSAGLNNNNSQAISSDKTISQQKRRASSNTNSACNDSSNSENSISTPSLLTPTMAITK